MAGIKSMGSCRCCGDEFSKKSIAAHLIKTHLSSTEEKQAATLVKVESPYRKEYWLYLDIADSSNLGVLDAFLRDIWLECCDHLSKFSRGRGDEFPMKTKIGSLPEKFVLGYEYDFGTTTELVVTFLSKHTRANQNGSVCLLARNNAPEYFCHICQKPATTICFLDESPSGVFYCDDCFDEDEHDEMFLPVTNSPRMGECGYTGDSDYY